MNEQNVLDELIRMSREIGKPENDYVILSEGNTSARIDEEFFFVKGSGMCLSQAAPDTFAKVRFKDALELLEDKNLTRENIGDALIGACAEPGGVRPSVETLFHAFLQSQPDVNFIAHTHPVAVNMILCSRHSEEIIHGKIFPDECLYGETEKVYIPCPGPGLDLARAIRYEVKLHMVRHDHCPNQIMIENHGMIALGKTARECEVITAMAVKAARVLRGTYDFGGPRLL